jgi:hypothetical protein
MRLNARRIWIGAVVIGAGLVALAAAPGEAADVPDDVLPILIDQDAKQVVKSLNDGKPDKKVIIQIKSSAMMIAAYAQSKITGSNPTEDAKYATLRKNALKVVEAAAAKKFKDAVEPSKLLSLNSPADPKADTKPLKLYEMHKFDINDLMAQYKKSAVGGQNVEADIKDFSKKGGAKPDQARQMAFRILTTAEMVDNMEPDGGFAGGKKTKEAWLGFNKKMKQTAEELAETAKAAKGDPKKLQMAFTKTDGACVACHDVFK